MDTPALLLLNSEILNFSSSHTGEVKDNQGQTEAKEVKANFIQDYCNKGKETPVLNWTLFQIQHGQVEIYNQGAGKLVDEKDFKCRGDSSWTTLTEFLLRADQSDQILRVGSKEYGSDIEGGQVSSVGDTC